MGTVQGTPQCKAFHLTCCGPRPRPPRAILNEGPDAATPCGSGCGEWEGAREVRDWWEGAGLWGWDRGKRRYATPPHTHT